MEQIEYKKKWLLFNEIKYLSKDKHDNRRSSIKPFAIMPNNILYLVLFAGFAVCLLLKCIIFPITAFFCERFVQRHYFGVLKPHLHHIFLVRFMFRIILFGDMYRTKLDKHFYQVLIFMQKLMQKVTLIGMIFFYV
jgi:hypothetical protein